ncbi:MAG: Transcriptional regulatory protein OmpR [Holosporales bacterium]
MDYKKLLIVDDDNRIRDLLGTFFEKNQFVVTKAASALQARGYMNTQEFDLIILDVMMPQEDGFTFAKSIREKSDIPIIFLSAKDTLNDRIEGLEDSKADDYMVKPFEPQELLARVRSILRRSTHDKKQENVPLKFGDIYFDLETARLFNADNEEIVLTSTEQFFLKILCQNAFKPVSRQELVSRAGFSVNERTIDVQITRLRKKLADDAANNKYIKTIRHIGYAIYPQI